MVTEKSIERVNSYQVELTLTIDADSIKSKYQEELNKTAKEITLPGFRKGKAPASLLESKYGDYIKHDSLIDVVDENFESTVKEFDLKDRPLPYASAQFKDESVIDNYKIGDELKLTVTYEATPVFDLPPYTGLSLSFVDGEVTDADIDSRIAELRDQNALVRAKDGAVADGDIVTCNYVEVSEDGEEIESTKREDFTFTVGSSYNMYHLDSHLIGMQKGESKVLDELKDDEGKSTLVNEDGKGLKVEITEIKVRELPEVDDEFAEDVKEEYKSVSDLREGIKAEYEEKLKSMVEGVKDYAIMKELIKGSDFEVPPSMLKAEAENRFKDQVKQTGLSEDQLLSYYKMSGITRENIIDEIGESLIPTLKQQIIMDAIKEKEDFKASDEEIEKSISAYVNEETTDEVKEYYKTLASDEIAFSKVLPFLVENNTLTPSKTLCYKDYEVYVRSDPEAEEEQKEATEEKTE